MLFFVNLIKLIINEKRGVFMSKKKVEQMFTINFRFMNNVRESISFRSLDTAQLFWDYIMSQGDLVYADRLSWDLDLPFSEVEYE